MLGYKASNKDKNEAVVYFQKPLGPKWGVAGYDYIDRNLLKSYFISVDKHRYLYFVMAHFKIVVIL